VSADKVLLNFENKSLIEFANCKFESAKIRLVSQHNPEAGTLTQYKVEIAGN